MVRTLDNKSEKCLSPYLTFYGGAVAIVVLDYSLSLSGGSEMTNAN